MKLLNDPESKLIACCFYKKEAQRYVKINNLINIYKKACADLEKLDELMFELFCEQRQLLGDLAEKGVNLHAFDNCENADDLIKND